MEMTNNSERIYSTEQVRQREIELELYKTSRCIAVKVLKALRKQKLSQQRLADQMGVSPHYIEQLVKGQNNISLKTILKLERILNIEIIASEHSYAAVIDSYSGSELDWDSTNLPTIHMD